MVRLRHWFVVVVSAATLASPLRAQEPKAPPKPPGEWLVDRTLAVTPAPEPVPALKYRLFPLVSERRPGNAVPIYIRLIHERNDATRKRWFETPLPWLEVPAEQFPLAEARAFVAEYAPVYRQLELGARRQTAEWNYTLDEGDPIGILLPDVQTMRGYGVMLAVKLRLEVLEGHWDAAAHTCETLFAFARHVGEADFLISSLVGIAIANRAVEHLTEWVGRPGSPNLYWSLTALPRPLIDLRKGNDLEYWVLGAEFPELTDLGRPRTIEQWAGVLKHIRTVSRALRKDEPDPFKPDEPAEKSAELPAAREYLVKHGRPKAEVEAMPAAQVLVIYLYDYARERRDDAFKAAYLPFPQAQSVFGAAGARHKAARATEAEVFADLLLPALNKVMAAQIRLERRIASLRVIEALRLHAAAHGGQLPASLANVTVVPIPDDPGTGKPFEYHLDGDTATLISRLPGLPAETTNLRYRVTVKR